MKDRQFLQKVYSSDLWNIGINGIIDKKIDKSKMSDRLSNTTKWIIRGTEAVLIGLVALKCRGGYVAPTIGTDNPSNNFTPTETNPAVTPIPTLTEQNVLAGKGEFTNGDPSLPTSLKELLNKNLNIEIPIEAAIPFSVEVQGAKFDFVSLAPLENKELELSWGERLFIRINNELADLDRKVVTIDNNTLVLWSYINNGIPEPVLWYPSLTKEQWQDMTDQQKKDLYAGFAPPSPLEGNIPGFYRSSDQMFAISFQGMPEGVQKVLASLTQTFNTKSEAPLPEGTRVGVDVLKEDWIKEFPGLEKFVQVDKNGIGTISFDDGKTFYNYDSKDTIFKFAGKENIWVAGWEFELKDGKYEYKDVIKVLAPRWTKDENGNEVPPVNPSEIAPHINELSNLDLLALFMDQTADKTVFDHMGETRDKVRRSSDHFKTKSIGGGILLLPYGEEGRVTYANSQELQFSIHEGLSEPVIYGNESKGTIFNVKFLDFSDNIHVSPAITPESEFPLLAKYLDKQRPIVEMLYKIPDTKYPITTELVINNAKLLSYSKDNKIKFDEVFKLDDTVISTTLFLLRVQDDWR